jgi:uncharacterized protein YjiS (DUF1127 family)
MRTISSAPTLPQGMAAASWTSALLTAVTGWVEAYMAWRIERAAIATLSSMSDRALKDIGLTRSEIMTAVRGEGPRDRRVPPLPRRS